MSEPNTESYSASKGGLLALTHALAISLGPDIRVNCVSPGWIATSDYTKLKRKRPRPASGRAASASRRMWPRLWPSCSTAKDPASSPGPISWWTAA